MSAATSTNPSQVEKFGKPTWRRLVEAVKDDMGGNNPALAQTIAREHPGVLPYTEYDLGTSIAHAYA